MDGLKIPVALVFAMAVQLVALVWYISNLVHDIEHLQTTVSEQQEQIEVLDQDVNDLWDFCTFTENKWAEAYTSDMVYERLCGTKEVVGE
jgi:cell division protein FtsB